MDNQDHGQLGDWESLVVGHAGPPLKDPLRDFLLFDRLLARTVLTANEPALAQLRLAWWREELGRERDERQAGPPDPLLASLLRSWAPAIPTLQLLIDGWEAQLPGEEEGEFSGEDLARGRAEGFAELANIAGAPGRSADAARHGALWAYAELALVGASVDNRARQTGRELADDLPRLPRDLRSLAIVGGLSRRALKRGGQPLFGDRLSPFAALRLGIFGT